MVAKLQDAPLLHIRFHGRSFDVPLADLDVGDGSSDHEIKRALAVYLNAADAQLRDYTVDRHRTGNLTVRPEAVFG